MSYTDNRHWSTQFAFLAAAIGSAVGISNIWKFTYVAGENGGGLFTLVYILALVVISVPALIAELLIGRSGGKSVVGTMQVLSKREGISRYWRWYGVMAASGVFLALSFYCVIAGWTVSYMVKSLGGAFDSISSKGAVEMFMVFQNNPVEMIVYQLFFLVLTGVVVARGIHNGLEAVLKWLTPGLFLILILLVFYSAVSGDFSAAFRFMFVPVFEDFKPSVILTAVGQAFFSLGVGLGVLMTVGAYMKKSFPLGRAALIIAAADGGVAILAGLAIFPLVFQYGLSPAGGPGLIFTTLPIAFGQMAGGHFIGPVFFLLLALAALTSSITLLEAVVAWLEESTSLKRPAITWLTILALWLLGLATVFSFNIWSDVKPLSMFEFFKHKTIFDLIDYLVSNLLMPVGGILVAVLAGWSLSRDVVREELNLRSDTMFKIWHFLVRFIVPLFVCAVFIVNILN
ncbi:sodium-dependent transporter [Aestuariicella hydrocarbonica]|uniref:Sodium-dependent transporter n=1 Tax=Pseudomaricurvus hydrocarbonicus TaxID=1470433 RepID=A0A9E5MQB3_9GAMM|nr:sodium-dependent transporter [Aestuariicella hydrocarbonica]NHO68378.1 sodium-dependent transporter [Aestuariicella hydrocarbonica]